MEMHTNTKKMEVGDYAILKEMAMSQKAPKYVNEAMARFLGEPESDTCKFSFHDIHNFYVDHWHRLLMDQKIEKSSDFKEIHNWIKRIGFKFRLNAYDTIGTTVKHVCKTCRGTGLFVHAKQYYHLVNCPDCNGSAKDDKSFCKTCAVVSPFGMVKGSGKVLIESKIPTATVICQKCSGMGVRNGK